MFNLYAGSTPSHRTGNVWSISKFAAHTPSANLLPVVYKQTSTQVLEVDTTVDPPPQCALLCGWDLNPSRLRRHFQHQRYLNQTEQKENILHWSTVGWDSNLSRSSTLSSSLTDTGTTTTTVSGRKNNVLHVSLARCSSQVILAASLKDSEAATGWCP